MSFYRDEIDGLRALAIIPVILFHTGHHSSFAGGYIGVDVFFVISGYLITSVIENEREKGNFSLVHFYERRCRRILPALFFILLISSIFAYCWMSPDQLKDFGQTLISIITLSSNIFFWWKHNRRFTKLTELNPLVHTWSLAAEEQFYLVFPLICYFSGKKKRHLFILLIFLALLSFFLAQWGGNFQSVSHRHFHMFFQHSWASYYLPMGRVWELLLGCFAAFYLRHNSSASITSSNKCNQLFALIGLVMIIISILFFDAKHIPPFPNCYTLVPTLGATLIILFGQKTLVGQLLSQRLLRWIGLISYSAYLWHQPLIIFIHLRYHNIPQILLMLIVVCIVLALSCISYTFIEQPFRNKKRFSRKHIFFASGVSAIITLILALFLIQTATNRTLLLNKENDSYLSDLIKNGNYQYVQRAFKALREEKNTFSNRTSTTNKRLMLIGDSFAHDFYNIINEGKHLVNYDILVHFVDVHCQIYLGSEDRQQFIEAEYRQTCANDYDIKYALPHIHQADVIILSSYWRKWAAERLPMTLKLLNLTKQQQIFVIGLKNFGTINPRLYVNKSTQYRFKQYQYPNIDVIEINRYNQTCPLFTRDGKLITYDGMDLTKFGAIYVGNIIFNRKPLNKFKGYENFKCYSMGTSSTKPSRNITKPQGIKPTVDSSSYILGKNTSTAPEKNSNQLDNNFEYNRLNFIPDSKKLWDLPVTSRVPRTTSVLQKSSTISNLSVSPQKRLQYLDNSPDMSNQRKYKCDQCGIVFPSDEALFKHKTRFCIGVKDSGIGRKPVYSDDEEIDNNSSYEDYNDNKKPTKIEEINEWKLQRSMREMVEDIEDQILDNKQKSQKLMDYTKKQDDIYHEILVEYERLQKQEQDVLCQMYNLQIESKPVKDLNNTLKQTNQLTDNQNDRLEELQRRNHRLEQERRIIQQKLEELISANYQPTRMSNYDPYRVLREMKEQQELNEKALDFLRGLHLSTVSTTSSLPYATSRLRRAVGDNVRSSRNDYMHSGGHDANVITRYSDLEYQLSAYEQYPWTKDYPEPLQQIKYESERQIDPITEGLKLANQQNERLQYELEEMHKKFDTLSTRTRQLELSMSPNGMPNSFDNYDRYLSSQNTSYQRTARDNNNDQLNQHENNQQKSLNTLDKRITRVSPAPRISTSNINKYRNPLAPHSYDPVGGFIIFFDFIVNLPSTIQQCRLITSIHHPKSGLGEPSELEPVKCEKYTEGKFDGSTNVAFIATKQPVPGCPPQQALTIVIEVQTSTNKQAPPEDFETKAWTKLALFDSKNRLCSGRWKVPLKALPVRQDDSLAVISRVPTFGGAELYYRLVNSQDANDQSDAPLSLKYRENYIYPVQYRN
ncbi:unnamed protein product [Rotaria sp. Silwood1]|nr:unnamed protein product [Rotaria sp. Silwood1]